MTARPEHTPAYESLVEQAEPAGPHFRVVHPEPSARRLNGHGHALARRAPQPIARATGRAPVEWITDRMILEFAARGGRFEEHSLPPGP